VVNTVPGVIVFTVISVVAELLELPPHPDPAASIKSVIDDSNIERARLQDVGLALLFIAVIGLISVSFTSWQVVNFWWL